MNILRSSSIVTFCRLGSRTSQFVLLLFVSRIFPPTTLGIFFLFQSVLRISGSVSDLGVNRSIEKRVSEDGEKNVLLSAALVLKLGSSLLAILVILLFNSQISRYIGKGLIGILCISLLAANLSGLSKSVLRGKDRVVESELLALSSNVIWIFGTVILVQMSQDIRSLIIALILADIVVILYTLFSVTISFKLPRPASFKSIYSFARYNYFIGISNQISYSWIDIMVIGTFLTSSAVAIYEVSWRVSGITAITAGAVSATLFPKVSNLHSRGEDGRVSEIVGSAFIPSLVIVVPSFFGSLLYGSQILSLLFGVEYGAGAVILQILIFEKIIGSFNEPIKKSIMAVDKPKYVAYTSILTLVLNLVLNIILINVYGLIGAAIATTISYIINTVANAIIIHSLIEVKIPYWRLTKILLYSISMLVLLVAFGMENIESLVPLIISIITGSAIYFSLIMIDADLRKMIVSEFMAL